MSRPNYVSAVFSQPKVQNHVLKNYKRIFPEILGYNYLPNSSDITEILLDKYVGQNSLADAFENLARVRINNYAVKINLKIKIKVF